MLQFYQRNPGLTIMMGLLFAWALAGVASPHLQLYQENRGVIWTILNWIFTAAIIYSALVALLYLGQRSLQYFPEPIRTTPLAAGLPKVEEVMLDTADGEHVIVWHTPPRDGYPVFLYFHGHAGSLRMRAERFRELTADGSGLVALSYRGFGGSSGQPTEAGLIEDAATAYTFAAARYGAERIVLWGESLGTALAIATAAEKPVGHVVLEAPLTSAADVGALQYWFVPVHILMKDQFRADLRVGKIAAPTLIVHGENDAIIPIALGERLYDLIRAPKRFLCVAGAGHTDLGARAVSAAKQFIAEEHQRI